MSKEKDGVDVLAEVSAARAMARFREEDLPVNPITIRPQGYAPNKAMSEAEEFMKHIEVPRASSTVTSLEVASGGMHAVTRGRYEYLNDFMDSMEVKEEERRPMTKREIQRAQKFFKTSSGASKTIGGAFLAGTALCVSVFAASWWYTKSTMKVLSCPQAAPSCRPPRHTSFPCTKILTLCTLCFQHKCGTREIRAASARSDVLETSMPAYRAGGNATMRRSKRLLIRAFPAQPTGQGLERVC